LGYAYGVSGKTEEAQGVLNALAALAKQKYVPAYDFAEMHLSLGETEEAFEWLEKAYQERSRALVLIKVEPRLDRLRGDPRFVDLLQRVGLGP
jgi:hypothetical protein